MFSVQSVKAGAYRNYLLTVLLIILAFNSVDRLALGLVLQDIKTDLVLSDTQLGFLSGIAFALFYALMGVPIARWADSGNRVTIIAVTTALWSAAVALSAAAGSFVQLALIRTGVAVGEAGCVPPAHSLIADYFGRAERPRAVALYTLGASLSVVIGYFPAGWLNQLYGWRVMFVVLGLPGVALSALAWFSLREPRCAQSVTAKGTNMEPPLQEAPEAPKTSDPSLKDVCLTLWGNVTFRHLLFGFSVLYFFTSGILQWQPVFMIRSYGMETGELGTWFAVMYGLGGALGTYWGGQLASRHAASNERLQLVAMAFASVAFGVLWASTYLAPNKYWAFALMGIATVVSSTTNGPLFAAIQSLVPPRMRATSVAILYLFANLIGMGLGPWMAGALSDLLRPAFGDESLRYALLCLCPGFLWAGLHLWLARRTIARDLEKVHEHILEINADEASGTRAPRISLTQ